MVFDKDFKIMVIKILTDLRRRMDERNKKFNMEIRKYKRVPSRSHRLEEYNN